MCGRALLAVLMAVLIEGTGHAQTTIGDHPAIDARNVSDDIVQVIATDEIPGGFWVYVIAKGIPDADLPPSRRAGWTPGRPLESLSLQAWVLRRDGTTLRLADRPSLGERGNGGWKTMEMIFRFQMAERRDIVGVVISAAGKLYVWEIPPQ